MKTIVQLSFVAESVAGKFMDLQIAVNDQPPTDYTVSDRFDISIVTDLPANIEFRLSGKSPGDTQIENGQIIADKHIKLETIGILGYQIETWRIPGQYLYIEDTAAKQNPTNYWGNGIAHLVIDQADPAFWLLECPKIFN